jgi:hypothetical protein
MIRQAVAVLLLVGPAVGCGASYQRVYEGDVRFEHCYRLDSDTRIPQETRRQCWADWAGNQTEGQTRDRVEYAANRQRALLAGDARPTGPAVLLGVTSPAPPSTAPRPHSNLHTIGRQSASLIARPALPPAPAPSSTAPEMSSNQACKQDCGKTFTSCIVGCDTGACSRRCGDVVKSCLDDCL